MNADELKEILLCLLKPAITISDLQIMTNQSYEKARRDFKKLKKKYIDDKLHGEKQLLNQREIPLNSYTLEILELWYGINKGSITENISILNKYL